MEEQKDKNEAFLNNPQQGRMVQFYKPPTTNSKNAHPKLTGKQRGQKELGRETKDNDTKQQTRPWKFLTFPTLEDVKLKSCCSKLYRKHI